MLTRGDRARVGRYERDAARLRAAAARTNDPRLRDRHLRAVDGIERVAERERRHSVGLRLWGVAIVMTMTMVALLSEAGLGWWGLLPAVAFASLLAWFRRYRIAIYEDSSRDPGARHDI